MATRAVLAPPSRVPVAAPADADGIAVGSGPVTVDAYIDFLCPFCECSKSSPGKRSMRSPPAG